MAGKLFLAILFISASFSNFCYCQNNTGYLPAVATWYKDPTIAGSGGACGLENDVADAPYNGMIAAGNQALFQQGKGCGVCYQVKCTDSPLCSGAPIKITVTDECPGTCNNDPVHFDLSWIAFGFMAKLGQADPLRNLGRIDVQYKRVPCRYFKTPITFKVDKGSNPYYLAVAVEHENGDGDIGTIEYQAEGSNEWLPTSQSFGATYAGSIPESIKGKTISIRLTQKGSGKSVIARNVIPGNFQPGQHYRAHINFKLSQKV